VKTASVVQIAIVVHVELVGVVVVEIVRRSPPGLLQARIYDTTLS